MQIFCKEIGTRRESKFSIIASQSSYFPVVSIVFSLSKRYICLFSSTTSKELLLLMWLALRDEPYSQRQTVLFHSY